MLKPYIRPFPLILHQKTPSRQELKSWEPNEKTAYVVWVHILNALLNQIHLVHSTRADGVFNKLEKETGILDDIRLIIQKNKEV